MTYPLVAATHPVLRQGTVPCTHVGDDPMWDDVDPIADVSTGMLTTMRRHGGVGLAAPQIGMRCRLCVLAHEIDDQGRLPEVMVDPHIVRRSLLVMSREACLSLPGENYELLRSAEITVEYSTPAGARRTLPLDGYAAIVAQHEVDHLDGVMIDRRAAQSRRALRQLNGPVAA